MSAEDRSLAQTTPKRGKNVLRPRPRRGPSKRTTIQNLPGVTARSLDAFAASANLDHETAAFLALRKAGLSQADAYLALRPDVTDDAAKNGGFRMERASPIKPRDVPVSVAHSIVADFGLLTIAARDTDARTRLSAIDMVNRLHGRYGSETSPVSIVAREVVLAAPRDVRRPTIEVDAPPADA